MFFIFALATAAISPAFPAEKAAPENVRAIMDERLAPKPVKTEYFDGVFNLSKSSKVSVETPAPLAEAQRQTVIRTFKAYWGFAPSVSFAENPELSKMKPEGYGLEVSGGGMKISARDFDGTRHALKTARQLAETGRDGDGYYIQACKISDFPALAFRAVHLCIYPETTPAELEKRVRLAAYYKFNYVVLEPWGTFPFESHPELSFFNKAFSRSELRRIVDLAYSAAHCSGARIRRDKRGRQARDTHSQPENGGIAGTPRVVVVHEQSEGRKAA